MELKVKGRKPINPCYPTCLGDGRTSTCRCTCDKYKKFEADNREFRESLSMLKDVESVMIRKGR